MLRGILKGNLEEAVLMTMKNCFALHDLDAATKLTVYEYKMARREAYNDAVVAYNGEEVEAKLADSFFVPASCGKYTIKGKARVLVSYIR